MRQLIKYDLDLEKAHEYIKSYVSDHFSNYKDFFFKFNFNNGHFYTLLPKIAYIDRLYDFDLSGILPAEDLLDEMQTFPDGEVYIPKCVFTTVAELKSILIEYLEHDKLNKLLMLSKDETELLNVKKPSSNIKELISKFTTRRFYIICLFEMNLDAYKIDKILPETKMIFFPAYDEEAFLVWKRHDVII